MSKRHREGEKIDYTRNAEPGEPVCMYKVAPKCFRVQASRGMCDKHHGLCQKAVRQGKITWEELEEMGWAIPPKNNSNAFKDLVAATEAYRSKKSAK